MKTLKSIGLLLLLAILTTNCHKDEITKSVGVNPLPETENVKFQFVITNTYGRPVLNTEVNIGGDTYFGGENGVVITKGYTVPSPGMKAVISANGFESLVKSVYGQSNNTEIVRIWLTRSTVNFISTGSSGEIHDGGALKLPSTLVRDDGTLYSGEVTVKSRYLNPDDEEFLIAAPGNMLGVNKEDKYQQLASAGMYRVDLFDSNDEKLQIPEGSNATITFPLAEKHQDLGLTDIPLWYYDEELNAWKEEGFAEVVGNSIIAEVGHFSWWNCDFPYDFTDMCLTVLDNEGKEISGLNAHFYVDGIEFGNTVTNSQGVISENVPINKSIQAKFFLYGDEISSQIIGPYDESSGKQFITIDQTINTISGVALDCEAMPISNGYGFFKLNSVIYSTLLEEDGRFKYSAPNVEHNFVLIDVPNEKITETLIPEDAQNENMNLNEILVCEYQNMTRVSGTVRVDSDGDQIADAKPTFGWVIVLSLETYDAKQVFLDDEGYFECIILPGIEYDVHYTEHLYRTIASGDNSPEGNVEGENYEIGRRQIKAIVEQDAHDKDNDFLVIPAGEGTISGSFLGDTDGDGVGDIPLEWANVGFGEGLNYNEESYVKSDGTFSFATYTGYHELRTDISHPILVDWDTSPDPDGDDSALGSNEFIPVIVHKGEDDLDNEFVVEYVNRSNFLCQVLEDTNEDGIGDVPVKSVKIVMKDRNTGGSKGSSYTQENGLMNRGWAGFDLEQLTVTIESDEYEVIDVVETLPDNDPFIIDGDRTKMEIDLTNNEWDAGNIFVVRKI